MIRILIIDDHPITVDGTKLILSGYFGNSITIKTAGSKNSVLKMLNEEFDLIISDIMIPEKEGRKAQEFFGVELVEYIKKERPHIKVIILTMLEDVRILRKLIGIGVNSVLLKSMDEATLIKAVKKVISGCDFFEEDFSKLLFLKDTINESHRIILSPYEEKVLNYTAHGLTEKEIGYKINKSTRTVERHIKRLKMKLDAENKENMVFKASKLGLI